MTALLGVIWPYLAGAGAALAALLTAYLSGRSRARKDAAAKAYREYRATRERIDDAPVAKTASGARRWLEDRGEGR